jgi:hypothetical protein
MSVVLLLLFSFAMICAIAAKMVASLAGLANITCVCLLFLFVIGMRVQGIRKPVV